MEGRGPYRRPEGAPGGSNRNHRVRNRGSAGGRKSTSTRASCRHLHPRICPVILTFLDGSSVTAKIEREDRYNLVLTAKDGIHIVYKHAIKEVVIKQPK